MLERKQGLMCASSCIQGTGHLARADTVLSTAGNTKGSAGSVVRASSCTKGWWPGLGQSPLSLLIFC